MAGRGPQSFKKRQKEQQRKEKQQEKFAKRLERKRQAAAGGEPETAIYDEFGIEIDPETDVEAEPPRAGGNEAVETR